MKYLWLDIRYAIRQLRKARGFTLTAVLTLAFGIGATTAIFSIVEGVLLRPLPFFDPQKLVMLGDKLEGSDMSGLLVSAPEMIRYSRDTSSFSSIGGYNQTFYELSGVGDATAINAAKLTANVFPTLGVSPILGRTFTQQEDEGRSQVTVISFSMWQTRFHSDPRVVGAKIQLDRKPYEIIGVMPREFEFPLVPGQLSRSQLWVPMSVTQSDLASGVGRWNDQLVGRLKPGVTVEQAQQDGERVAKDVMRGFPAAMASVKIHAEVQRLDENTVAAARPLIRTLFLAVAVVLFMACANLAGLLLVRVIRRRREISVRLALGATGAAVLRQNLVETMTLSIAGGLIGLAFASIALRVGLSFLPETLPRISSIGLDWKVVGFAMLLAAITGLLCGMAPAFAASRTGVNDALKEGGRTGTSGAGHARLRSALVVAELAVAFVLLVGAGLLLRSFEKLRTVDLGYRTDHMLTASYALPHQQYSKGASVDFFTSELKLKLAQLPGVQAVGFATALPGSDQDNSTGFIPEGYSVPKGTSLISGWNSMVIGDYFKAAGIPIIRGRAFNEADRVDSPLVVIVNRTLAERYWPGQDPLGKRMHLGVTETQLPWMTVVGEIADIKQGTAEADIRPQFYIPASQFKVALGPFGSPEMMIGSDGSIVLRSSMPPEQLINTLLAIVRSIDPQLPLTDVMSMDKLIAEGQAPRRFNTALISSFAIAAVLLALLGIYSVIAFSAALRTQEMAIRLALGSQRSSVLQLILASGLKLGLIGSGLGAVGAFFATRLLRSMLFEINPLDPAVLIFAACSIFVLAMVASLIPARRAAAIEPMQALRAE